MEIIKGNFYETKDGKWLHVKEVTYYLDNTGICNIVTGGEEKNMSDAASNVVRQVFTYKEFMDLLEVKDYWNIKDNMFNAGLIIEDLKTLKEKILEDIEKHNKDLKNNHSNYICPIFAEKIINKRFGL